MIKVKGFSMLEVLISMLIIMMGALGIAGLQMQAINNTEVARYQTLAALLASSVSADMQGNVAYWGVAPASVTISGTSITGGPGSSSVSCTGGTICTASQMAAYSLSVWGNSVANVLPNGTATIACAVSSPATCKVTLNWNDNFRTVGSSSMTGSQSYITLVSVR